MNGFVLTPTNGVPGKTHEGTSGKIYRAAIQAFMDSDDYSCEVSFPDMTAATRTISHSLRNILKTEFIDVQFNTRTIDGEQHFFFSRITGEEE